MGRRSEPETGFFEMYENERVVSGQAVILRGIVDQAKVEEAVTYHFGEGWDRVLVEVQHLSYMPRVKWCERYDGFGCDLAGEWHAHWFGAKHNPAPGADCCRTIGLPSWPSPPWLDAKPVEPEGQR